jgi:trans-aconitate methyltransferase
MTVANDLDRYLNAYASNPFQLENEMMLYNYARRCIKYAFARDQYLELGIGHGITLTELSRHFSRVVVLEGASALVEKHRSMYANVEIIETYFEIFQTTDRYDHVGMGFVLEHVDDPVALLDRFRAFLTKNGSIFIGVPSASSLHRILAHKAGLLDDVRRLSETDRSFGHKRFLTYQDWIALLRRERFRIVRAEGLYLKPFSTAQIESLNLESGVFDALVDIAASYPEISNAVFIEVRNEK